MIRAASVLAVVVGLVAMMTVVPLFSWQFWTIFLALDFLFFAGQVRHD